MKDAGVQDPNQCYLVDDSSLNIDAAQVGMHFSLFNFG
jgi:hypothetical protein